MTDNDYLAWLVLRTDPEAQRPRPAPTCCASCGRDALPPEALAGDPVRCVACWYRCADDAMVAAGRLIQDLNATVLRLSEVSRACGVAEGKLEGLQRAIAAYAGHVAACERCRAPWDACEVAAGLWRDMTVLS